MTKRILVTAALPYSNGRPHVGHLAGCYLPADIFVRFQRLCGKEVKFICGSDDHGVAIKVSAEKEGMTPAEVAKHYNQLQKESFKKADIIFDIYSATSNNPTHVKQSQDFFLSMEQKGYFEKQVTKQFYDQTKDMFLPDRYVKGTCTYCNTPEQYGDQCENCGKLLDYEHLKDAVSTISNQPAIIKDSTHWYIDLSRSAKVVENWINTATLREHTRNYVKGLLGTGLVRRSMTRDLDWGIPVPLNDPDAKGKVLYVWFDAPIGYISFTEELTKETYKDWWTSDECDIYHFIGEDNTIFHCVIWIAMLSAEGSYKLPKGVLVNQYLNIEFPGKDAEKISKSRGNAIWIDDYFETGGESDTLRYYLTIIAPEKARSAYNPMDLIQRHNTDLANTLGNFVNRIISFSMKYFGEKVPALDNNILTDIDQNFLKKLDESIKTISNLYETFNFRSALENTIELARDCNRYVDEKAPWTARKTDLPGTQNTMVICLRAIYALGILINPVMPNASSKILKSFNIDSANISWDLLKKFPLDNTPLTKPDILFNKIEN
jgi:methionyl-tRNA synthetase